MGLTYTVYGVNLIQCMGVTYTVPFASFMTEPERLLFMHWFYMYVCMYVCTYIHTYKTQCMYVCMYVHTHTLVELFMNICRTTLCRWLTF